MSLQHRHDIAGRRAQARTWCLLAGLALLWFPGVAVAQDQPQDARAEQTSAPGYRIGPGDLLTIGVTGVKQLQESTRVSNSGKIHVPYLGIMKVADMTPTELEREIAGRLRSQGLVNDPWVSVRIDQYRAQPVYVLGEVMTPGQFVIKDEMYLIDLVTLAGGFNEVASPVGYLYRRKSDAGDLPEGEAPTDDAIPIDFQALNEGTRPELNMQLRGGDVLYVPQRRKDYICVVGDVVRPGVLEIRTEDRSLLLSQALAQAGGPLRTAKMSKGLLVRVGQNGERKEIPVDFKAILQGRKPDMLMQANDIIFIPGSTAKTLGYGMLGVIPNLAQGAVQVVK